MSDLADKEPQDGVLSPTERRAYLQRLDESVWEVVDGHHLEGSFDFSDFNEALAFTNEVGELADEYWHHPDIHLSWGNVSITLYSHDVDGLQELDFVLAANIEQRYHSMLDD
ncbi:4a-hydroxytetrahydrobiopterin dehydratase [Salinarchaeum sp. IM2453]|uniref:4a-hydroxytetrahydrobiopterin dehydratase n=1 Tax=Salinarchaeum sp. IM2453 TaxID=2862870 RepID=UPI001C8361ED|nr:4a-hydroxytetrahydrobiopterin dehydratase [Salinarchaeum sp. IM2453]QZA88339.1 4a-hydroxytetrahydrobiopterin dehydratase [Salinarchaeum sp. IM2453]